MKALLSGLLFFALFFQGCIYTGDVIKGDGNIVREERSAKSLSRLQFDGNFDVIITSDKQPKLEIETDLNVQKYVLVKEDEGTLKVKIKKDVSLETNSPIKVFISTPLLKYLAIDGSTEVNGNGVFSGADEVKIKIAGSGKVKLDVNTPITQVEVAGSGDVMMGGQTREHIIKIAGSGDIKSENLLAEKVKVKLAGSGNVRVHAADELDISIAGSGDVFYLGNPSIKQSIAGGGRIKRIDE
jgi:hypothetical protein